MKKFFLILVLSGLSVCSADEVAPTVAAPPEPASQVLTPEQVKVLREKSRSAREAREKAAAEKAGLSVEDFRKHREAERRARLEAREKAAAEKAGIPLEEFRKNRRAQHDERIAKRLGVTVEELRAMKPEELRAQRQKMQAQARAKALEKRAQKPQAADKSECK